ncbi:hypothetical protein ACG33_07695 [Steroidobacter denitrificans]|uniref:General secretion pathway protein M n=1 Tax=Steroidobacter denitrificans TaxID=465721 RepID=A0A127FBK0_STEDE|nr:type II secretion system protein GspM [Steroidobacter denitrificans]AMN46980.1 hypothetical protein ACG33_07695 [Steroidobacter denitrificans]
MNLQQLKDRFHSLQAREQLFIGVGVVLAVLLALYTLALAPFHDAVKSRSERVVRKEADLAWMRGIGPEMLALNAGAPAAEHAATDSLVVLVDRTARECGLGTALTGQTPDGETGIRVRLEAAEFDTLVACLGDLQQRYAINVESATIDRSGNPGYVNASLVLTRAGS